jgi:hypothetical protein
VSVVLAYRRPDDALPSAVRAAAIKWLLRQIEVKQQELAKLTKTLAELLIQKE